MNLKEKELVTEYFLRYASVTSSEIECFFSLTEKRKLEKNEYLLSPESICRYHFFILEGLTRTFYVDANGNEKITQFGLESWWLTNWSSFKSQSISNSAIQAIEPTTVLQINKPNLELLLLEHPIFERIIRQIAENWLIAVQKRSEYYLNLNSKSRYEQFRTTFPEFAQRVPQYMIASYLEITPQHLSTIRSK
jgi:CRP/FNR family transcriptional regulator